MLPKIAKCENLHPAINIITDRTKIITTDALKCDCINNNIKIGGAIKKIIGFKKPFHICFKSPLCLLKYAAKNSIKPNLVISDG